MKTAPPGGRIDWPSVRDRIDLTAVATDLLGPAPGRRGERGGRLWWPCPFHQDNNPSFCIRPGERTGHCFGCGETVDAAALAMRVMTLDFPEAVRYLAGAPAPSGRSKPRPEPKPRAATPHEPEPKRAGLTPEDAIALVEAAAGRLWTLEGEEALSYLAGPRRRLAPGTIRAARLGWTPRAEGVPWKPPGVVIPWFASGRLALVKVRPPDEWRAFFPKDRRPPKYIQAFRDPALADLYPGPEAIRPGRPLIVTEGEFDTLLLGQEIGDLAAVITLGSASARPDVHVLEMVLSAAPWFIATDADDAGDRAAAGWPARRVRPPGPYKDWTEAASAGVNLRRWWGDVLASNSAPPLFTWDELAPWRWGPAVEAPSIDRPTSARVQAPLVAEGEGYTLAVAQST